MIFMSARAKHQAAPVSPSQQSKRFLVIGFGLIGGVFLGAAVGIVVFLMHRTTIDLGTIGTVSGGERPVDRAIFATYAGSSSCKTCHAKEYESWSKSHHGLAERPVDAAIDKAAFVPTRTFKHGTQESTVRATGDRFEVVTQGYETKPTAYPVERVIGVDPLRQFLTPAPGGRLQTLEASYDPNKNQWFDVYGNEDRRFGEWGHWTGRGMNWNSMCASCHNTRVRKNYDEKSDTYQTAMAQLTVSCESCHGPMKQHVEGHKGYGGGAHPATLPSSHARFSKDQNFDTCGSCHARRADLTGNFVPGDAFEDHYSLSIPDLSEIFYADGQVREEDYEFTAFSGSKMHAAGVRCLDCHDPHSSKTIVQGNLLCMRCHNGSFKGAPLIAPEQHSFHKTDSAGNQCVNCHMPQTTYMQRHGRHDHGFTIPDPLLTKQFEIPNACNRCHTDKKADWSLAAVEKWYGPKMQRPTRERAQWLAKARRGDDSARQAVLKLLKEEKQPFWQAVSAAVLGQWVGAPDVTPALVAALESPSPLVRENAIRALEPITQPQRDAGARLAVGKLLSDPVRSVRVRAAWSLRDAVDPATPAGADLLTYLKFNGDQPGGAMQQGIYAIARNDVATAVERFNKSVTWDPNSAPFRDSLAVALSLQGNTAAAAEQLEWAAKLDPQDAEYPYKLALAESELGHLDKTIELLQRALKLNPRHPRAAYNLGLAYNQTNQPDKAIEMLRQAETTNPGDAQISYALATIYNRQGRKEEARAAAQRALEKDPTYSDAARLLESLQR
jgi:predicted CXXCH cytochrome family protein